MNTFYQMWGVTTPEEAQAKIDEQKAEAVARMKADGVTEPRNLEEQAQVLIGKDIYEKLIKGYTEKQWGRKCTDLPALLSSACLFALSSITTTSMISTRVFLWVDIIS